MSASGLMDVTVLCVVEVDVNVATIGLGAQVVEGEVRESLLRPDEEGLREIDKCTRHEITDTDTGIVVRVSEFTICLYSPTAK